MANAPPTLHLLCGKIAAGKSTLSAKLGQSERTVVIAEDDWLKALHEGEMRALPDYVRRASNLRRVMGPHIAGLLNAGVSVVLDFAANTAEQRRWMRAILDQTDASHVLHVLDVPDELCLARLRARNAQGAHPFTVTEAQFRQISGHFEPPSPDEGFNIMVHSQGM